VNQGGSIYSCVAIPYNEFGFSNTYLYPRTSGSVVGETIEEACQSITQILNNQTLDEAAKNLVDLPDEYSVTVDSAFRIHRLNFLVLGPQVSNRKMSHHRKDSKPLTLNRL